MQQIIFDEIFSLKKCDAQKLSAFGFVQDGGVWKWRGDIKGSEFELCITVSADGKVDTSLTERATGEPYILYKTSASGAFVGEIREEICAVLREVAESTCSSSIGLAMCAFMPDSGAAFLFSSKAFAVMATIGTFAPTSV